MNANKKNIGLNNGWILCPSKSFPGKFYYFNVLNGEAAWSLSEPDKKGLKKEITPQVHKIADKSHEYPEPTSLPDETSLTSYDIGDHVKKSEFLRNVPYTQDVPTFGQLAFPKYVAKEPLLTNIVWTPLQLPMFCPDTKKPMSDKVTQTSSIERELFIQTCDIPLCKRFKNYENPFLCFDKRNKILNKPTFDTSTPRNGSEQHEKQNLAKSKLIKDSVLKLDTFLPKVATKTTEVTNVIEKPSLSLGSKVESTPEVEPVLEKSEKVLGKLDQTDLRFLLLAKRRKSMDASAETVEKKKLKTSESKSSTAPKKKVTFDLGLETGEGLALSDITSMEDFEPLTQPIIETPKSPILNHPLRQPSDKIKVTPFTKEAEIPKVATSSFAKDLGLPVKKNTWYIVVDTDVLLLDYELIDNLVLSDPKCKLIIPHAVRADIESLCIGDCRGQQRVINARQLTRKLATPPPHYSVEPPPIDNGEMIVTTESILNCCLHAMSKNYYVVLITNDPHLEVRANSLNIPSYRLNDVKYGVDIKPGMTSQTKNIKTNTPNDDLDNINQSKSKLGLLSNLNTVKKQLHFSNDSNLDCDKLINITKPKFVKNVDFDSDSSTSDISREVQNLNLIDKNVLKPQNSIRNPFLLQNLKEAFNFENSVHDSNIFNSYIFDKAIQNSKEQFDFENAMPKSNQCEKYQNTENLFSKPISSLDQFTFNNTNSKFENPGISLTTKNINSLNTKKLNASQSRINKIFDNITTNAKTTEINKTTKEIDNSGIFKIPQPLQFKIRTRNTSALAESSQVNDKIRTRIDKDPIEESLKRFCIKSKAMREKISMRIDEWICSFMQIMEEALNNLLLKSSVCMEDTLAPLNLHDTLNYVKMLYDCHTKTRVIDNLSEMLDKCVASKGNLKSSIKPDDFMKMFGYGVMLVSALKNILPTSEELSDAELSLNSLLNKIESNTKEFDPELLKTPFVSRADKEEVIRPIFIKDQSYVLDYLKKHFKDWAAYKEDYFENDFNNKEINHSDFKVLRTSGKNLNLLKINRSKAICLQNSTENDTATNTQSKIIRLIENNHLNKPCSNTATITEPKLIELCKDDNENVTKNHDEDNFYPKVIKQVTNITKTIEKNASEIDGPKMIRNMTLIDEYEKRIQNREPLDLDLLDYSEIYEPSVAENPEFDIIEENVQNENNFENIAFTNMFTENFTKDIQLHGDIFHTEPSLDQIFKINHDKNSENMPESTFFPKNDKFYAVSGNTVQDGVQKIHEKSFNDNSSDKNISNNDSCVANDVSDINVDSENVEIRSANFEKSTQVLDESTNDSGFENDSTYAHSVVKIFLNELSTSFKVIFKFITSFVNEIRVKDLCDSRKNILHNKASKSLEDMVAIIQRLRSIIKRESGEDTVLKSLLLKAGVEATTDKRITRYRQIVIKSLEQALILEKALKIIVSTTIGDYDTVLSNAETINSSIRYFNIFE